jgi:hypothetical protein
MIIKDLIKLLENFPETSEVLYYYDSAPRGSMNGGRLNKQGKFVLYDDEYFGKPPSDNDIESYEE